MLFPREQWRDVVGYENYEISNVGRIRNKKTKKFLKPCKNNIGYLNVGLCKNGTQKTFRIHRLVGEAFIPNPENKPQIDHIDTNKTNNYYKNLRWVTPLENSQNELTRQHLTGKHHSLETKRKISEANKGENHPLYGKHHSEESKRKMSEAHKGKCCGENNPRSKPVEILKNGVSLGIFPCAKEIERKSEELFGVKLSHSKISAVCTGKCKHHKKYQFKFVD